MVEFTMKLCELKIKDSNSLNDLTNALVRNGYDVQISPVWQEYPCQDRIDHFAVRIGEKKEVLGDD